MSSLAIGSSVTITCGDDGYFKIATNGGSATIVITPAIGSVFTSNISGGPYRRIYGQFAGGASAVLTNISCSFLNYSSTPPVATTAATVGGIPSADGTKSYAFIDGVIRNANDGNGWVALVNSTHDQIGISSVTNDTSAITVNFNVPSGGKVITFVVAPDDGYAKAGYFCGASVGTTSAAISLRKQRAVADYVSYNGTTFVSNTAGVFTQSSYTAGVLTLTHATVNVSSDGIVAQCVARDGTYVAHLGSAAGGSTQVKFYDWAGTLITTADTNMKVYLNRGQIVGGEDPSGVQITSANLWFTGKIQLP